MPFYFANAVISTINNCIVCVSSVRRWQVPKNMWVGNAPRSILSKVADQKSYRMAISNTVKLNLSGSPNIQMYHIIRM